MRNLNRISNYWRCQIAGWGFVTLVTLFFAYAFGALSSFSLIKVGITVLSGFLATHLLRWSIKQTNWLSLPIEKAIVRFLFAAMIASAFAALIAIVLTTVIKYSGRSDFDYYYTSRPRFSQWFAMASLDQGLFILPWTIIYCFYNYVRMTRHQLLESQK